MSATELPSRHLLGMRVDGTSYADAADRVISWARAGESRYVCVANVHMVMEAHDDPTFRQIVNDSDLVTPDGMPLVWALRRLGIPTATRVYGPDLTPVVCERAASAGVPVGLYGGAPEVVARLAAALERRAPGLEVAFRSSPPFRALTAAEEASVVRAINGSGARILFVGLGCPKQERFMAQQAGTVRAVMLGVGQAFDLLAGAKRRAPLVLQQAGLEWAFRLASEPRRLWRRYLRNNPRFVALLLAQLVGGEGLREPRAGAMP